MSTRDPEFVRLIRGTMPWRREFDGPGEARKLIYRGVECRGTRLGWAADPDDGPVAANWYSVRCEPAAPGRGWTYDLLLCASEDEAKAVAFDRLLDLIGGRRGTPIVRR